MRTSHVALDRICDKSANVRPLWGIDRNVPNLGPVSAIALAKSRSNVRGFGRAWPDIGRTWPGFSRIWAKFGIGRTSLGVDHILRSRTICARLRPRFGWCRGHTWTVPGPHLGDCGRSRPDVGPEFEAVTPGRHSRHTSHTQGANDAHTWRRARCSRGHRPTQRRRRRREQRWAGCSERMRCWR